MFFFCFGLVSAFLLGTTVNDQQQKISLPAKGGGAVVSGQVPDEMSPQRAFRKVCEKWSCTQLSARTAGKLFRNLPAAHGTAPRQTWSLAFFWTLLILEKAALMMNPEHGFLGHRVMSLALAGYVTLDEPLGPFGSQFLTVHDNNAETPSGMELLISSLSSFPAHKGSV